MRLLAIFVGTIVSLLATSSVSAQAGQKWSERGIFVFGGMSLDFESRKVKSGWKVSSLENCSNSEFYCARSELISLVLPRKCASNLKVGDAWEAAGVRTRVVGAIDEPVGHLSVPGGTLYVLQTANNPRVAFIYKRSSGVLSVLSDPAKDLDLSWTKPKGRGDYSELTTSPYWRAANESLLTFDTFGGCYG